MNENENQELLNTALKYLQLGYSLVPAHRKQPTIKWTEFQKRQPTNNEIRQWFSDPKNDQLSLVCGKVSGGLIGIDFDHISDEKMVAAAFSMSFEQLKATTWIVKSPHGFHVHFLCPEAEDKIENLSALPPQERKTPLLIELKTSKTLMISPPSKSEDGTPYENLSNPEKISKIDIQDLKKHIQTWQLLQKNWQYIEKILQYYEKGRRAKLTLGFAGFLRKYLSLSLEQAQTIFAFILAYKQDEEAAERISNIRHTYEIDLKDVAIEEWFKQADTEQLRQELFELLSNERRSTDHEKGKIELPLPGPGIMHIEFATKLGEIYSKKQKFFFDARTGKVVRISPISINPLDKKSSSKVIGLEEVTREAFIGMIEEDVITGKLKKIDKERIFVPQSLDISEAGLVLQDYDNFASKLPRIEQVLPFPMPFLIDGKLYLPKKGYDEITHTWLDPNAPEIDPNMPLDEAKQWIESIHEEFAFYSNTDTNREEEKKDADKINAFAKLITPDLRGIYSQSNIRTPVFIIKSNQPRTGKDYLSNVTQIVYTGHAFEFPPISTSKGTDESELKKLITSILLSGERFFHSSNNEGRLYSSILEQIATNEMYSDRLLGGNRNVSLPNILEISLSANIGLVYSLDLQERSIIINLFYPRDNPNKRTFKQPNLHEYVKQHRSEILSAIYALIRNWYEKGMPLSKMPFASFSQWMAICGGVMEAAGWKSPVVDNDVMDSVGANPELRDIRKLFAIGYEETQRRENRILARDEVVGIVKDNDLFSYMKWNSNEQNAKVRLFKLLNGKYRRMIFQINGRDIKLDVIEATNSTRNQYAFVEVSEPKPKPEQAKIQQNNENSQNAEGIPNASKDSQQSLSLYGCMDCIAASTQLWKFIKSIKIENNIEDYKEPYKLYTYTSQIGYSNNILDFADLSFKIMETGNDQKEVLYLQEKINIPPAFVTSFLPFFDAQAQANQSVDSPLLAEPVLENHNASTAADTTTLQSRTKKVMQIERTSTVPAPAPQTTPLPESTPTQAQLANFRRVMSKVYRAVLESNRQPFWQDSENLDPNPNLLYYLVGLTGDQISNGLAALVRESYVAEVRENVYKAVKEFPAFQFYSGEQGAVICPQCGKATAKLYDYAGDWLCVDCLNERQHSNEELYS